HVGVSATFMSMLGTGVAGVAGRIYPYPADRGWEMWNIVTTRGVALQIIAVLFFVVNVAVSLWRGERAGADPWDAWTLEWATASPPPEYNFETIPVTTSRRPLWDMKHPDDPASPHE